MVLTFMCLVFMASVLTCAVIAKNSRQRARATEEIYAQAERIYKTRNVNQVKDEYFRYQLRTYIQNRYPDTVRYEIVQDRTGNYLYLNRAFVVQLWKRDGSTVKKKFNVEDIKNAFRKTRRSTESTRDTQKRTPSEKAGPEDKSDDTKVSSDMSEKNTDTDKEQKQTVAEETKKKEKDTWIMDHIGDIQAKLKNAGELDYENIYYPAPKENVDDIKKALEDILGQDIGYITEPGPYFIIDA